MFIEFRVVLLEERNRLINAVFDRFFAVYELTKFGIGLKASNPENIKFFQVDATCATDF